MYSLFCFLCYLNRVKLLPNVCLPVTRLSSNIFCIVSPVDLMTNFFVKLSRMIEHLKSVFKQSNDENVWYGFHIDRKKDLMVGKCWIYNIL